MPQETEAGPEMHDVGEECRDGAQFVLEIRNTCTNEIEKVVVTEQVYRAYLRTGWAIENNNRSFFDHEIQESSLSQSESVSIETLAESVDWETDAARVFEKKQEALLLHSAIDQLSEADRDLIQCLFFEGMTNAEYGRIIGTSGQAVGQRKVTVLKKLKNILKKSFRS